MSASRHNAPRGYLLPVGVNLCLVLLRRHTVLDSGEGRAQRSNALLPSRQLGVVDVGVARSLSLHLANDVVQDRDLALIPRASIVQICTWGTATVGFGRYDGRGATLTLQAVF